MNKEVLICQNRPCRASNSSQIIKAFQAYSLTNVELLGCSCLNRCGNGPIALILPQKIWYQNVTPHQVKTIVEKHLIESITERLETTKEQQKTEY
jgi:(2Fe-2S) ferredoxin